MIIGQILAQHDAPERVGNEMNPDVGVLNSLLQNPRERAAGNLLDGMLGIGVGDIDDAITVALERPFEPLHGVGGPDEAVHEHDVVAIGVGLSDNFFSGETKTTPELYKYQTGQDSLLEIHA